MIDSTGAGQRLESYIFIRYLPYRARSIGSFPDYLTYQPSTEVTLPLKSKTYTQSMVQ